MATTAITSVDYEDNYVVATWTGIPNGNDGGAFSAADFADMSVQIYGTFGAGGSVTIQGSLDGGTTWAALADPNGNALTKTAAALEAILEPVRHIRPNVTAGDGTTAINVTLYARRTRK